jgi:pimeloyl-ACP methyl ester carboxylesterase
MRVVFVHGACVRDGEWWWRPTAELLAAQGIASIAAALPSCGETELPADQTRAGLAEDVARVRSVLAASDEPTILVAHSYGGIVAAEAAAGIASVRHILLISSYLPEVGQSLSDFGDGGPAPFLQVDAAAGTFTVDPDQLVGTFLQDCTSHIQAAAAGHLAHQTLGVTGQSVEAAAWHDTPTTYLVCAQDGGTPARLQREYARRADHVVEVDSGHHPFLSQPAFVSDLVLGL